MGVSVAAIGDTVSVGQSDADGSGTVFVFAKDAATGQWAQQFKVLVWVPMRNHRHPMNQHATIDTWVMPA